MRVANQVVGVRRSRAFTDKVPCGLQQASLLEDADEDFDDMDEIEGDEWVGDEPYDDVVAID
jgi:hypothetical protein